MAISSVSEYQVIKNVDLVVERCTYTNEAGDEVPYDRYCIYAYGNKVQLRLKAVDSTANAVLLSLAQPLDKLPSVYDKK